MMAETHAAQSLRMAQGGGYLAFLASGLFTLCFWFSYELSAQSSSVPYGDSGGPSFHDVSPEFVYPASYPSIREVDFQNSTVYWFDEKGRPDLYFRLKNGSCEREIEGTRNSVSIMSVHFLNTGGVGRQYALMMWAWFSVGGSSSQGGIAQLFELYQGRLKVTQQIDWDEHFQAGGPYYSFDEKTNTLVVRSAHYLPGDAHCCVSAMDVVTFRWNGRRFVQTALGTALSDYGKREGKTLRP